MKYFIFFIFIAYCFLESSCKRGVKACQHKNELCDSATICLGNFTNDTIEYEWNDGRFGTLLPGKVDCIVQHSSVNVTYDKYSCDKKRTGWFSMTVKSTFGDWAISVESCRKISNFRYDAQGIIGLYDETP